MEPEKQPDFDAKTQAVVRAILAVGAFLAMTALVVTDNAADIPDFYVLLAGAAIGIFIGGNPLKR